MDKYTGMLLDGRYELLEPIGVGGMAIVYKARCHRLNRLVAVKILKEEYSKDAEFKRRFETESRAVAMLSHPNIVSVYDVSRTEGMEYIVMELIDGMSLKDYMLKRGRLGWRETLHFSTLIAKALEHAHSRGVIHRDIKPHNIMVLRDGSVKVADFGIARLSSSQHTLTQEALGSVHYISPEQARGSQLDARTDIYSLGVVMYEMLTGRLPYDGESPVAVAIAHINSTPVLPHELAEDIPQGLEYIAMKAMTADLSKRYASASDLLEDLEQFRKNPETLFGQPRTTQPQPPQREIVSQPSTTPKSPETAPKPAAKKTAPTPSKGQKAQQKKKKDKKITGVIAAVACVLIFLLGVGTFLYNYLIKDLIADNRSVIVPQFVGVSYDAIDPEDYPDLQIELESSQSSSEYVEGVIMDQTPESGREVRAGAVVKLTVSSGENVDQMPDVVNVQQQVAIMTLDTLRVKIDCVIEQENSDYVSGYVIRTVPEANTQLKDGDIVTLVVSLGPKEETVVVPSVIGLLQDAAILSLTDAGLKMGEIRSYENADMPQGTVYFQSVDAGDTVALGTTVNIYVSLGSLTVTEPTDSPEPETSDQPGGRDEPINPPSVQPEVTPEPEPVVRDVVIHLPQDVPSVKVTVKLNQVTVYEQDVVCDTEYITVQISGTGQQFLDIYFDDILRHSDVVNFQ